MTKYVVRFSLPVEIVVDIDAETEEDAADEAWPKAQERLNEEAVYRNHVALFGDLDGIGADTVEEIGGGEGR